MRRHRRVRLAVAALPVAAALLLAGCGAATSSAASASAAGSGGATQVISVSYKDGQITPPESKVPVKVGTHVEIRVTSDVSEIVHNHYNNVEHDVAPGGTVVFDFTAETPGVYEVELHKSDKLLLELQVQ
jgi:Cupredoxin-like domain